MKFPGKKKTKIEINYSLCGDGIGVDPRKCRQCLLACEPAVFLLHQTLGKEEVDMFDPQLWRITALWLSLCTKCMKCVDICPKKAISLR